MEASKPQVNIHPCVIAKWITFATPLYCNLAKDYYPPNTCTYNLFNLAPRRADEAVWWSGAIAINVIKQTGEIYIKHLSSERAHGSLSLGEKKNPVWHFDVNDDLVGTVLIHLRRYQSFYMRFDCFNVKLHKRLTLRHVTSVTGSCFASALDGISKTELQ